MNELRIIPLTDIGPVEPGDDLAQLIAAEPNAELLNKDCVVVNRRLVSRAEGRLSELNPSGPRSRQALVERESVRVVRKRGDLVISETEHGFVCADGGVKEVDSTTGEISLLPVDSDRSARGIRDRLRGRTGVDVAVIINDAFGRPWRRGVTGVAVGCAGIRAIVDTKLAVVDEIASAAHLVMNAADQASVAIVRGIDTAWFGRGAVVDEIVRDSNDDLFR